MKRQTRSDRQKKSSVLMQKDAAYTKWLKNNNRNGGCNCLRSIDMTEVTNHIWLKRNRAGTGIYRGELISMEYCVSVSLFDAPHSSRFTYSLWFALYFRKTVALFLFYFSFNFIDVFCCLLAFAPRRTCVWIFFSTSRRFCVLFPISFHLACYHFIMASDCTLKAKQTIKSNKNSIFLYHLKKIQMLWAK